MVLVDVDASPVLARRLEAGAQPEDPAEADLALLLTLLMEIRRKPSHLCVVKGHEVESRPLGWLAGVLSIGRPG